MTEWANLGLEVALGIICFVGLDARTKYTKTKTYLELESLGLKVF